jgi:phosphoribosylamine--glycine ligase
VTPELSIDAAERIVKAVLDGHRADGDPYIGFLYVSLILTAAGPKVIEFNVRFGDPEAQAVMPLVEGPFARLLMASATGSLAGQHTAFSAEKTVGVVLASRGYPAMPNQGSRFAVWFAPRRTGRGRVSCGRKMERTVVTAGGRVSPSSVAARHSPLPWLPYRELTRYSSTACNIAVTLPKAIEGQR